MKGRVVDQQGRPVANATVSILGRAGEAVTDADGRFTWTPDPPPPFEILVVTPGGIYREAGAHRACRRRSGSLIVTVTPLVSESVTVSGSAPEHRGHAGARRPPA